MAIDDELIGDVANVIAHGVNAGGGAPGWSRATALDILKSPALIKRMAEGVGFEVKEKPERYYVAEDCANDGFYVYDRAMNCRFVASINKQPIPELARRLCQQLADELNSKERP